MRTDPSATHGTFCLRCKSVGDSQAATCWMCGSTDLRKFGPTAPAESPVPLAEKDPIWHLGDEIARPRPHAMPRYVKPVVAVIGVIIGGSFLIGVWQESPVMAVMLMLIVGVVIRAATGRTTTSTDPGTRAAGSVLRIFGTVATTLATIILIFVVGMVAMFAFALITCLGMLKGG
jgi:hypothetical protein